MNSVLRFLEIIWSWPSVVLIFLLLVRREAGAILTNVATRLRGRAKVGKVEIELGGVIPPSDTTQAVERVLNRKFQDDSVEIDGKQFVRCGFQNVTLLFRGERPFGFQNCEMDNVTWEFIGSAAETLAALQRIYGGFGDFGRNVIERTFRGITSETPSA